MTTLDYQQLTLKKFYWFNYYYLNYICIGQETNTERDGDPILHFLKKKICLETIQP